MERIRQIYSLTIIITGDIGVGKTNIIYSYTKKIYLQKSKQPTAKNFFLKIQKLKEKK